MSKPETISLYEFFAKFPKEESARLYFENKRWSGEATCAHCGSETVSECKDHKPMPYRCKSCRKHFSVRTGTVLAESRLPLHKWLMAMYMMTTARKGISSVQMAKELGVTQKTAWFLAQRIRECWLGDEGDNKDDDNKLEGVVEVDQTYIGGKSKGIHSYQRAQRKHYSNKQAVVSVLKRGGEVRTVHTDRCAASQEVHKNVAQGNTVMTDAASVYKHLRQTFDHHVVNHSVGEYVRGQAHTNDIESFWALLKRGHYGIYHYVSPKQLNHYVNEFASRRNTREIGTMGFISSTITRSVGKRIKYLDFING